MSAEVDDKTAAYFDRTIAAWRCDACGTEFTVDSVFARTQRHGRDRPECPVCPVKDAAVRIADHPESKGGWDQ